MEIDKSTKVSIRTAVAMVVAVFSAIGVMAFAQAVNAKDLGIVDPTLPGQGTLTITCGYPVEREDGTPLAVDEIAKVNFFVEKNGTGGYVPAGENTTACYQTYDLSAIPNGAYVYVVTVVDKQGRESVYSDNPLSITLKRVANPNIPTNLDGSLS